MTLNGIYMKARGESKELGADSHHAHLCGLQAVAEATNAAHVSPSNSSVLLNTDLADYKGLLGEVMEFMTHKSVPTQYATKGYRIEYHKALANLRKKISAAGV